MKLKRECPVSNNEYSGRSDKKYCSLVCKNKESNKTVMQLYYAGKTIIEAARPNKVLPGQEKLKSARGKSSNHLKERPKKQEVPVIGRLKIKELKNFNEVQKKYQRQFIEEEQLTIDMLKEQLSYLENQQLLDTSNSHCFSNVSNIIKELKAGKVLSCVLRGEKKTTILKYIQKDTFQSIDYSIEI